MADIKISEMPNASTPLTGTETVPLIKSGANVKTEISNLRSLISVSGDLSYNSNSGEISFTERTDQEARDLFTVTGDLIYNSSTGTFSFTERTDQEVRNLFSAVGDLSYNSTTGEFSVDSYTDSDVQNKLGEVSGNIIPDANEAYDLGSSSFRFRDLYLSGTTVDLAGTKISSNADGDVEITDSANRPKKIKVAELELGDREDSIKITKDQTTGGIVFSDQGGTNLTPQPDLSGANTDQIQEGTQNLYYSDIRARSAISATGDLSYDSSTGEISFTERTDSQVRGLLSATGDLSYDSSTGEFSVAVPEGFTSSDFDTEFANKSTDDLNQGSTNQYYADSLVDAHLSGGIGVSYSQGVISIGQSVGTTDDVSFNNITVSGNLTVSGTTTTIDTETIELADNNIVLNSNYTGSTPTENAGFTVNRGSLTDSVIQWNETADYWEVLEGGIPGRLLTIGDTGSGNNLDADQLDGEEGSYYLDYTNFTNIPLIPANTSDLTNDSGFITSADGGNADTLDGEEGSYYLDYNNFINTPVNDFASKDTDDLTEGTNNKYYADSLVDNHLEGGTGVSYSQGVISIGQSVGTTDNVSFNVLTVDTAADINNCNLTGTTFIRQTIEAFNQKANSSGFTTFNFEDGAIWQESFPTGDITASFVNVPVEPNTAINIVVVVLQGPTAYTIDEIEINGQAQSINWAGGSPPTPTPDSVDTFSFTFLHNSNSNYTVLASLDNYG